MNNKNVADEMEKAKIAARDISLRSRLSTYLYLVIFGIIVGSTPFYSDYKFFVTSIGIMLLLATVIRGVCVWQYNSLFSYDPKIWLAAHQLGVLLQAGAWGMLSIMSIQYYDWQWTTMVICLSAAAFSAGAVNTLSALYRLTILYLVFMFLPTFVVTLLDATEESIIAAFLFGTYFMFLVHVAKRLNNEYWGARKNAILLSRRAEELEAKNAELETFAYSVSHDLRSPLRSIDGFSKILLDDSWNKLDEQEQDYLKRIRASAQKMGELIDDLLLLSKVSRANYSPEVVNLSDIVKSNFDKLKKQDPKREMDLDIEPDLQTNGDRSLLDIAMSNLIDNACKYTSKRPHSKIRFGTKQDKGEVVYYLKDNGVGFDTRYKNKLFGPFQRLHTNEEFSGTGIGLATVHRIIDRHGGKIWANAKVDRGATFYFTLPGNIE